MIFLYLVAAITAIITFALSLLPGADFLAFPTAATAAIAQAGSIGSWFLNLAGADVRAAILTMLPFVIAIKLVGFGWQILRKWRPPGLARTL